MRLPQMGLRFGFGPAPERRSKRGAATVTIISALVLKTPHEPVVGWKDVPVAVRVFTMSI